MSADKDLMVAVNAGDRAGTATAGQGGAGHPERPNSPGRWPKRWRALDLIEWHFFFM